MSASGRKRTLESVQIAVSKRSAFGQERTFNQLVKHRADGLLTAKSGHGKFSLNVTANDRLNVPFNSARAATPPDRIPTRP